MNIILSATVENIATRSDGTIKVVIGTQEIDNENAARLLSLRNKYCKVLISDSNIEQGQIKAVEKVEIKSDKKSFTKSQHQRFKIEHIAKLMNIDPKEYYNNRMDKYLLMLDDEISEIIEQLNNK